MLEKQDWVHLANQWDEETRKKLILIWHRLNGMYLFALGLKLAHIDRLLGWPDSSEGLRSLKKKVIIATLSNGNARLLIDMVG